ncbi:MAG: hydantoinase/oxoprolinase family protein [Chloroflexi bacterium]|nr:hydantoinase/oxoprolinase family protein [Chloroflexota bacterium]
MRYSIGIDIGGTFTDGVVIDEKSDIHLFKTPTVPNDPATGLFNCLSKASAYFGLTPDVFLGRVHKLTLGTTIATNAVLQGTGAATGLITTRGFRDTLPIARVGREYLPIDIQFERYPCPIPRRMIEEVTERVDRDGAVVTPLDLAELEEAVERLLAKGAEAIAVCFLWSFQNSDHERQAAECIARRWPGVFVSLSSEIAPILGEYERTATVVLNSLLGPLLKKRLGELGSTLKAKGLQVPLLIMQSNGGLTSAGDAASRPVTLLNSGPVGGIVACKYLNELLGRHNIIGIDMGGTSLDVSLINSGEYSSTLASRVNNNNIYVPSLDVHSIGAGGGSVAWVDMGRVLKVGPQSAGADPGPACYGRGGVWPTVTDADLTLGRLDPDYFLGGEMPLDMARSISAIKKEVADPLGIDAVKAAQGICQVVDAAMADAVRLVTVRKGRDPRDYVLVAFGGAGAVHAAAIARELSIATVIVPCFATVQSAFGIVSSDIVHSFARSEILGLDRLDQIELRYEEMERQGRAALLKEGIEEGSVYVQRYAEMRYRGQDHEITVGMPDKKLTPSDMPQLVKSFEEKYQSLYGPGTIFKQATIEVVTIRANVAGATRRPALREMPLSGPDPSAALVSRRSVFFPETGDFRLTPVFRAELLKPGNVVEGPAIVQYTGTTVVVPPGWQALMDKYQNLIMKLQIPNPLRFGA